MDTISAIHTRRSIRRYLDKPISEELVEKLLAAAMQSPSARNQQPWQFVVIDDRALLAEIPTLMPNASMAAKAPLAFIHEKIGWKGFANASACRKMSLPTVWSSSDIQPNRSAPKIDIGRIVCIAITGLPDRDAFCRVG
jgi:nitroreductase